MLLYEKLDQIVQKYYLKYNTNKVRSEVKELVLNKLLEYFPNKIYFDPEQGRQVELKVICDETNNPPDIVDFRGLRVEVFPPSVLNREVE